MPMKATSLVAERKSFPKHGFGMMKSVNESCYFLLVLTFTSF